MDLNLRSARNLKSGDAVVVLLKGSTSRKRQCPFSPGYRCVSKKYFQSTSDKRTRDATQSMAIHLRKRESVRVGGRPLAGFHSARSGAAGYESVPANTLCDTLIHHTQVSEEPHQYNPHTLSRNIDGFITFRECGFV